MTRMMMISQFVYATAGIMALIADGHFRGLGDYC